MNDATSLRVGAPPRRSPRCTGRRRTPVVLVAVRHPTLRRWTTELLESACGCWRTVLSFDDELLASALVRSGPDVVALDSRDFPACCEQALARLEPRQVVVIGPAPDPAYRRSALDHGAGAWVSQDQIGDELPRAVWRALGCDCLACPLRPLMTTDEGSMSAPAGEPS